MPDVRFRFPDVLPLALVVGFLLFDVTMPLVLPDVLAVLMIAKGIVIAETWLLAVWAALGSAPWIKRVAMSLALSVAAVGVYTTTPVLG